MPTHRPRKSLAGFLIDTGLLPLTLLGKSARFFGVKPVAAFVLGAGFAVGYSHVPGAPYVQQIFDGQQLPKPPQPEQMDIHGIVKDWGGQPPNDAIIYLAPQSMKPDIDANGSFSQPVPVGMYQVIVIDPNDPSRHAIANVSKDHPDAGILTVPPGVGGLTGVVRNKQKIPEGGKIVRLTGGSLVSDMCDTTDENGNFSFTGIKVSPVAGKSLRVIVGDKVTTVTTFEPNRVTPLAPIETSDDPLVTGTVRDGRGKPLLNLRVMIVSSDGRQRFSSLTAYDGAYSISVPTRGNYTIQVFSGRTMLIEQTLPINSDSVYHDLQLP